MGIIKGESAEGGPARAEMGGINSKIEIRKSKREDEREAPK
jgi:hypothetical protein